MDKASFTERIRSQFNHYIKAAERQAQKEIEGKKSRMDTNGFIEWLKTEQKAASSEPALGIYDQVLSKTPEEAASSLAALINLDLGGEVDWGEQFKQAVPILTNWKPEQSENWKFKGYFIQYIKAIKADARARVFSQQIEQTMTRETFIQYLESELSDMVFNIGQVVDQELSLKKDQSTEAGFLEYLKNEEQRLLGLPELSGLPGVENFTPAKVAYIITSKYNKPGTDWEATYFEVLNPSNMHELIISFRNHKEAQVRLWAVKKLLEQRANKQINQRATGKASNAREKKEIPDLAIVFPQIGELIDLCSQLSKDLEDKVTKPIFSKMGTYIGNPDNNASPLMAVSLALLNHRKAMFKKRISQTAFYRVLCKHFEVEPASAPHKAKGSHTYNDVLDTAEKYLNK